MSRDVSADNAGYDIDPVIPEAKRNGGYCLSFIEGKGIRKSSNIVTVTRNEILIALSKPEE